MTVKWESRYGKHKNFDQIFEKKKCLSTGRMRGTGEKRKTECSSVKVASEQRKKIKPVESEKERRVPAKGGGGQRRKHLEIMQHREGHLRSLAG